MAQSFQEKFRVIAYQDLKNFLAKSGYSNRKFATLAGIKPTTFQSMLSNESNIRFDTFLQIYNAMVKICDESVTKGNYEELMRIRNAFLNSHRKAEDIDADVMLSAIHEGRQAMPDEVGDLNKEKLLACYNNLNEIGQQEAVKRVEDLTYNPDYQKKEN